MIDPLEQARTMWADDPASRALGIELVELGPGRAVVSMVVRPDMVNGYAVCHGGLVASLADSAFALACNSRGVQTVAAGFDISLLEPAPRRRRTRRHRPRARPARRSGIYDVTVNRGTP